MRPIIEILDFENQHFGELARASGKFRSMTALSRNVPGTDFGDLVSNHVPTASKNMF